MPGGGGQRGNRWVGYVCAWRPARVPVFADQSPEGLCGLRAGRRGRGGTVIRWLVGERFRPLAGPPQTAARTELAAIHSGSHRYNGFFPGLLFAPVLDQEGW